MCCIPKFAGRVILIHVVARLGLLRILVQYAAIRTVG